MSMKKAVIILGLASVLFFLFSAPADAARFVRQTAALAWHLMSTGAQSIQTFVTTLIK